MLAFGRRVDKIESQVPTMQTSTRSYVADIVAFDATEQPILYAEVRRNPADRETGRLYLQNLLSSSAPASVKFGLLVDAQNIEFFRWDGQQLHSLLSVPTLEVFAFYDPEVDPAQIVEHYQGRLIEGWLRDIAYNWKSESPPFKDQLHSIGLGALLVNGTTRSEERLLAA